jgi:hypothetical protein
MKWLIEWFNSNCEYTLDGWEHHSEISINTLDNPGWSVEIKFSDIITNKEFHNIIIDNGDNDWINCKVINNTFKGYGDNSKLLEIINIFRDWIV